MTLTEADLWKHQLSLPHCFKWTKEDNSKSVAEVKELEDECSFRIIKVVSLLNCLVNTAMEELFVICKGHKHMNSPGRQHFKAASHLLHHL